MTQLDWDSDADAWNARNAGWAIDGDLWWWRKLRAGDPPMHEHEHFGFTTEDFAPGTPEAGRVFVRGAAEALAYDRKKITKFKEAA